MRFAQENETPGTTRIGDRSKNLSSKLLDIPLIPFDPQLSEDLASRSRKRWTDKNGGGSEVPTFWVTSATKLHVMPQRHLAQFGPDEDDRTGHQIHNAFCVTGLMISNSLRVLSF